MDTRAPLRIVACDEARPLADAVAARLGTVVTAGRDVWFACGEAKHEIDENVRGADVYVFQQPIVPGSPRTLYDRVTLLLHAVDALRHADAARVTAVLPYLPGARQDKRRGRTREGVATGLLARMLGAAGVDMVITVEPHNEAIAGCYDPSGCVFEPIYPTRTFGEWLGANGFAADLIASTDVGGLHRARRFAKCLHRGIVALNKERDYAHAGAIEATTVIGDVVDRDILVVDDIIDTAGSAVSAVEALWKAGARRVDLACIHPVLSDPAWERLAALRERADARGVTFRLAGTSSVVHRDTPEWYRSFPLDGLLAEVIRTVNCRGSVQQLTREEDG